jgi:hypothetical protein
MAGPGPSMLATVARISAAQPEPNRSVLPECRRSRVSSIPLTTLTSKPTNQAAGQPLEPGAPLGGSSGFIAQLARHLLFGPGRLLSAKATAA